MVWNIVSLIIEIAMVIGLIFAIRILKRLERAEDEKEVAPHEHYVQRSEESLERKEL